MIDFRAITALPAQGAELAPATGIVFLVLFSRRTEWINVRPVDGEAYFSFDQGLEEGDSLPALYSTLTGDKWTSIYVGPDRSGGLGTLAQIALSGATAQRIEVAASGGPP